MSGKKPTINERKIILKAGLDTYEWLVQKNSNTILQLVNRENDREIVIINKSDGQVIRYHKKEKDKDDEE